MLWLLLTYWQKQKQDQKERKYSSDHIIDRQQSVSCTAKMDQARKEILLSELTASEVTHFNIQHLLL